MNVMAKWRRFIWSELLISNQRDKPSTVGGNPSVCLCKIGARQNPAVAVVPQCQTNRAIFMTAKMFGGRFGWVGGGGEKKLMVCISVKSLHRLDACSVMTLAVYSSKLTDNLYLFDADFWIVLN